MSESGGWAQARMLHVSWSEAGGSPQLTLSPHLVNHMSQEGDCRAIFTMCNVPHSNIHTHTRMCERHTKTRPVSN